MSTYERIKQNRHKKRNRLFKRIGFLILIITFCMGTYWFLLQPWAAFGNIYITGNEKIQREEIVYLIKLSEPVNLFLINKNQVEETLKNDLRIKSVETSYELPNIFHIGIEEEKILFYVESNYGFVAVIPDGRIIMVNKNIKDEFAPIVTGISVKNKFVGDNIKNENTEQLFLFLNTLDNYTKDNISELNIYENNKMKVIDMKGNYYFFGALEDTQKKAVDFIAILKEVTEKNLIIDFVDLSYSKPYIKMKG